MAYSSETGLDGARLSPGSHYDTYWRESWSHRRLWWSLLVSACFHAAAISLLPAARYRPRIIEFPPLYEVQLVNIEPVRPAPKPPVKKRVVPPKKEAPKVVTPKVEPKKEKKPEEKRPKPAEKKPEEVQPAKPPAPPAPKVETKARIEADLPRWYYDVVVETVRRHWEEPVIGGDAVVETVVYFDIVRSGEVTSPHIDEASGNRRWDLAGLRAVTESRFPPLPPEYKGAKLTVYFGFKHEGTTANQ